jgi:flagellar hook-associated protein 2
MSIEVILKGKVMAISSLGIGSGILTQDLLDQLRKADESARVTPLTLKIANEKDMLGAYDVLDAHMTNFTDSLEALKNATLFDARSATVDGTSVAITADANSDIQEFTLDVSQLATKEIAESGKFGATTDTIADDDGSITISVGDTDYDIDYNDSMTLNDLKEAINNTAGESVSATIVKIGDDDYRLFLTSTNTGSNQDISITDNDGNLSGTQLTDDLSTVQDGDDAKFTFNGEDVTRHDNKFDDLIAGYHITLKETGLSTVSVAQNRDDIMSRVDSFVEKYNAMMGEINTLTKSSTSSDERCIFSS